MRNNLYESQYSRIVCWIPHCCDFLPLSPNADPKTVRKLKEDNLLLTDNLADRVHFCKGQVIKGEYSRFFCDLERFPDDSKEEMSRVGMGMLYNRFIDGSVLDRTVFDPAINPTAYYQRKHRELKEAVERTGDGCLLLDLHTFNPQPLPCDQDQNAERPDICIGINHDDTCPQYINQAVEYLNGRRFKTFVNKPFSGSMTVDTSVKYKSVMIEINKRFYGWKPLQNRPGDFWGMGPEFANIMRHFYDILLSER